MKYYKPGRKTAVKTLLLMNTVHRMTVTCETYAETGRDNWTSESTAAPCESEA